MIIRKKVEWLKLFVYALTCIIIVASISNISNWLILLILYIVYGLSVLKLIESVSVYDITKFEYKYTSKAIFISGLFFGILGGLIAYFLIKYKEGKLNDKE